MTWLDLVRLYFPNASDAQADYILWEHTGFPSFWKSHTPIIECRKQLREYKESIAA